jgi:hypothetical protein
MKLARFPRWLLVGAIPAALACVGVAQPPPGPIPKGRIERPLKEVVANTAPATPNETAATKEALQQVVTPKRRVESPVKETVANAAPTPAAENPTVDTGKVKWHKTLDDAQAAAKKSNKPVLLFQMMGYLDKKFC